jgi:PAS domain S-box-containing protein
MNSIPDIQSPDFKLLFESVPGLYLILSPDLIILNASDTYLRATMTKRDEIIGHHLFDVFPDNPNDADATGTKNLKASLDRVIEKHIPDIMRIQKYDVAKPGSQGKIFEERYWSPVNSPVLDKSGKLVYIIHRVEDVTEFVKLKQKVGRNSEKGTVQPRTEDSFWKKHTGSLGFAIVTIFIILITTAFYFQEKEVNSSKDWVIHTYKVLGHIQALSKKIDDITLSVRSYIIMGDEEYLKPYKKVISLTADNPNSSGTSDLSIFGEIFLLKELTFDNPTQQRSLDELKDTMKERLDYLAGVIELRKTQGIDAVIKQAYVTKGREQLDNIYRLMDIITLHENQLLAERTKENEHTSHVNHIFVFSGIVIFYMGLMLSLYFMQLHARRAQKMEMEIYFRAEEISKSNEKLQTLNQEVSDSRTYLKNIINHIPDPIFVKDMQHRWVEGNGALWDLFGKQENELLGKSDYDFFPKEEADVFWQKDEEVFVSRKSNTNIENFTDAAGMTHIISTKKACFNGPKGNPILVGVIRDITELTRIQEELKKANSEARGLLASIVEYSEDAIMSNTLDGIISSWNRGAEQLFEYSAEEIIGKHIFLIMPEERQKEEQIIVNQLREDKHIEHFETIRKTKDGRRIPISLTTSPLYDVNGTVIGASKIARDITNRKQTEASMIHYMQELERSNQELDDFAYIASHDLKEPLRGLFNHATFLLEDYKDTLDADGVRRLQRLSYLSQRMERLVNDLLYFARLGRAELAVQETNPNDVVNEIKQMMEFSLKERNAHITVHPMPNIICDKTKITEVFRNLITNAMKYNDKAEPSIEVGYLEKQGEHKEVFYVKDNGVGIEKEFYQEIFRIFKRLQQSSDKETGTGVGLTFVKKIVERHKGQVWLESELGKGSVFYFNINQGV